jgi:translocator protein
VTADRSTELTTDPTDRRARWLGLLVFLAIALAAGGLGSLLQGSDVGGRYLAFERPAWAPPSWAFGVVWPILYVLIGIAGWRVWRVAGSVRAAGVALGLWVVQLVVNAIWPGVFFGLEAFGPAVVVITVLDVLVVLTILAFRRIDRLAAWLLVPYLLWILYATALNAALWQLN